MDETEAIISRSALLAGASASAITKVAAIARLRHYARNETIVMQGERAGAIGIVAKGWMKLFRISPSGNEAVVRVFSSGESFGEAVALRRAPYPVSAAAVTDCSVLWLDSGQLLTLLREDPDIAVAILSSTFVHLHQLVNQVEQLKSQNGAQRVAGFLAALCKTASGEAVITLPYDKMLVAAEVGITPESLSRVFAKLRDHGVTIQQNEARIADVAALRAFAAEDAGAAWSRRG
jgi:CRP-like cAMP-binding protein